MKEIPAEVKKEIQKLLFLHPLYNWAEEGESRLQLLLIGDSPYAAAFADLAMQTGQMIGKQIRITWCLEREETKEAYLEKRPALKEFISIEDGFERPKAVIRNSEEADRTAADAMGFTANCKDSGKTDKAYAGLIFRSAEEAPEAFGEHCRYIFSASEDHRHNLELAELFKKAGREDCLTAYLTESGVEVIFSGKEDAPEFAEAESAVRRISSLEELDRMAFNTHRVWEGEGNLDMEGIRQRFAEPYNYISSVSFVLSIPYKLKSIGIHADDPLAAAREFAGITKAADKDPQSEEAVMLRRLAVLEHRRWVLEKASEGVRRLTDKNGSPEYISCIDRCSVKKTDDAGNLLMHPCMVDSTEASLRTGKFADHALWDDKNAALSELDELDRVSLELHRVMAGKADNIRKNRRRLLSEADRLRPLCCSGDDILERDFSRYYFCLENILDGSFPYSRQFETYERTLRGSLRERLERESKNEETLSAGSGKELSVQDEKEQLFSGKEGQPANDKEELLKVEENGLPLNEEEQLTEEEAEKILDHIRRTLFPLLESNLYRDYKEYDVQLVRNLPFILTAKSAVSLCLSFGKADSRNSNNDDFFKAVSAATALYADRLTYLYVCEPGFSPAVFESKLKAVRNYFTYRGMKPAIVFKLFTCKEMTEGPEAEEAARILEEAVSEGMIQEMHRFDTEGPDELRTSIETCLKELKTDYFDGTNPLVNSNFLNGKLMGRISELLPFFEFDTYRKGFINRFNCDELQYADLSSFIQVEDMFALMNAKDRQFTYQDYSDCYRDLWNIYCGTSIGEEDFYLCARTWTRLCIVLQAGGASQLEISRAPLRTSDPNEIRVMTKMLNRLEKRGFIRNLNFPSSDTVSCRIRDAGIKNIFLKAGELLEIYVYFEACRTGWFDDVQTGYSFKWEYDDVSNELDCVLTKGYRSILVECKSTKSPDEDYYLTLDSLADHFGIGYKKVLIMVTDISSDGYGQYKSRGKQMDIITISTKEELKKIGERLIEIMKM
ncbi:MAG: DUF1887 family protein [Lachnospiraceae bacterium]|nr:DUF1887 family protein [Lachnospiraceae bacterium]